MSRRPHSNSSPPDRYSSSGRPGTGERGAASTAGAEATETWKSVLVSGSHKRAAPVCFYMMRVVSCEYVFFEPFLATFLDVVPLIEQLAAVGCHSTCVMRDRA